MESFKLQDQVEELLRELGVDPPADTDPRECQCACGTCCLGASFLGFGDAIFDQTIELAPDEARLGDVRLEARHHGATAIAAVAMEIALRSPGLAEHLLADLPFDREQTRCAAASVAERFSD